jgi:hypothetical protein
MDGLAPQPDELQCAVIPIEPTEPEIQSFRGTKKGSGIEPQHQSASIPEPGFPLRRWTSLAFLTHRIFLRGGNSFYGYGRYLHISLR